ncbi:MAG: YajQ family cyclic di-GMP-binding protein [Vicinamibacteria bacterium]|nr:YajQ family cyclic di-GMP-binding protein [Vicinamibacteria bacterium]
MAESSFDIVSEIDQQEVKNAVAQALKEIQTRYDLKDSKSDIAIGDRELTLTSVDEYKLKAVRDILESKLMKRGISIKALTYQDPESALGGTVRQKVAMQNGIPIEKAREIVKLIKNSKMKVQAAIQGEQLRVTGKSRDDLQALMTMLRGAKLDIDMQFTNYR